MRSRTRPVAAPLLAFALACAVRGCVGPVGIGYQETGRYAEVEPGTGDTIITSYWLYGDGFRTATFKRIPRGNTDRRRDPPPPDARFRD